MCSGRGTGASRTLAVVCLSLALGFATPARAADPLGDHARQAKKPFVVDFGMTRCSQCIEQGKVMERIRTTLGDRLLTRFVHIGKEGALAGQYKVVLIPTIVVFDAQGREAFRNVGFVPYDELTGKLKELRLL